MLKLNKVLVFGATGAQGSPVVRELLKNDLNVRTFSRDQAETEKMFDGRAETARGDLLDTDSLRRAFDGVDAAFLLVPVSIGGANSFAAFQNALAAANEAGLKRLVFTTGGSSFDLMPKIRMVEALRAMTDAVLSSGVPSVVLRPTIYLENLLQPHVLAELRTRGTLSYPPLAPSRRVSWTAQEDQARFAVAALTAENAVGKIFDIATPGPVTGGELAEMLSKKFEREIRFTPPTPVQFGEQIAPFYGAEAAEMIAELYQATDALPENGAVIDLTSALSVLPTGLTTVSEWIDRRHWTK